jgi:hypothetical protein
MCDAVLVDVPNAVQARFRVVDARGNDVVRMTAGDGEGGLQFCADGDAAYQLEIVVGGGRGEMAWVLYAGEHADVGGVSGLWLGERVAARPPSAPACTGGSAGVGTYAFRAGEARTLRTRAHGGCQQLVLEGASVERPWTVRALDEGSGTWVDTRAKDASGSWAFEVCADAGRALRFHVVAGGDASVEARVERGCAEP